MLESMDPIVSTQLRSYFDAAMEKLVCEQHTRLGTIAPNDRLGISSDRRSCIPDIEMEFVGSRGSLSHEYDPDDLGLYDLR
ncbi:unnamed protein product [Peronospora belbahrii]|uniref:Uncharacterized protein n=1 Tax=Peronospora belbahrii TaxID=622444 RepID=A0AAU9KW81_9STRA|nr:unnamed protein product [Peronospora belbahrii]